MMRIKYYQDGEQITEPCKAVEFVTESGDVRIEFDKLGTDWLIIDKENFISVYDYE